MSRVVTLTYRPNADEVYQASVSTPATFPDAVDEARVAANKALRDMIHGAITEYRSEPVNDD